MLPCKKRKDAEPSKVQRNPKVPRSEEITTVDQEFVESPCKKLCLGRHQQLGAFSSVKEPALGEQKEQAHMEKSQRTSHLMLQSSSNSESVACTSTLKHVASTAMPRTSTGMPEISVMIAEEKKLASCHTKDWCGTTRHAHKSEKPISCPAEDNTVKYSKMHSPASEGTDDVKGNPTSSCPSPQQKQVVPGRQLQQPGDTLQPGRKATRSDEQSPTDEDMEISEMVITLEEDEKESSLDKRKRRRKRPAGKRKRDSNWEGPAAVTCDIELDDAIEHALEDRAKLHNLTATNVRNILHEVITNEHVVAMMKAAINETEVPMFEPKMTRSKLKEVVEKGVVIPSWNLTPVKKAREIKSLPQFVDIPLADEDSSDEEYQPNEDEEDETAEESLLESDVESLASSPRVPKRSRTHHTSEHLDMDEEGSATPEVERVAGPFVRHISAEVVPMGPPPPPAKPKSSQDTAFMEKLHAVDEELASVSTEPFEPLPESIIACRTRSKRTLKDVPIGQLEAELCAPDATPDMYDPNTADDENWKLWLQGLMKDDIGNEDEGDDEDDPEYNFLEDLDVPDTEDLRNDRAVRITKKEVNELMEELFDTFQEDTSIISMNDDGQEDDEGSGPEASTFNTPQAIRFEEPLANMLTQQHMTVKNQLKMMRMKKANGTSFQSEKQPEILILDAEQQKRLQQQMQQHVQLLTQMQLLCSINSNLSAEAQSASIFLIELSSFATNSLLLRRPFNPDFQTAFQTCNLKDALQLVLDFHTLVPQDWGLCNEQTQSVNKNVSHKWGNDFVCLPKQLAWMMATRRLFMYPELLPICSLKTQKPNDKPFYTKAEDNLLALGLKHFEGTEMTKSLISKYLLVTKTPQQVSVRIKNLSYSRVPDNIVRYYKKTKRLPLLFRPCDDVQPADAKPPVEREEHRLPFWLKASLTNIQEEMRKLQVMEMSDAPAAACDLSDLTTKGTKKQGPDTGIDGKKCPLIVPKDLELTLKPLGCRFSVRAWRPKNSLLKPIFMKPNPCTQPISGVAGMQKALSQSTDLMGKAPSLQCQNIPLATNNREGQAARTPLATLISSVKPSEPAPILRILLPMVPVPHQPKMALPALPPRYRKPYKRRARPRKKAASSTTLVMKPFLHSAPFVFTIPTGTIELLSVGNGTSAIQPMNASVNQSNRGIPVTMLVNPTNLIVSNTPVKEPVQVQENQEYTSVLDGPLVKSESSESFEDSKQEPTDLDTEDPNMLCEEHHLNSSCLKSLNPLNTVSPKSTSSDRPSSPSMHCTISCSRDSPTTSDLGNSNTEMGPECHVQELVQVKDESSCDTMEEQPLVSVKEESTEAIESKIRLVDSDCGPFPGQNAMLGQKRYDIEVGEQYIPSAGQDQGVEALLHNASKEGVGASTDCTAPEEPIDGQAPSSEEKQQDQGPTGTEAGPESHQNAASQNDVSTHLTIPPGEPEDLMNANGPPNTTPAGPDPGQEKEGQEEEEEEDFDDLTQDEEDEEMSSASEESVLSVPELQETMEKLTWLASESHLSQEGESEEENSQEENTEPEEEEEEEGDGDGEGEGTVEHLHKVEEMVGEVTEDAVEPAPPASPTHKSPPKVQPSKVQQERAKGPNKGRTSNRTRSQRGRARTSKDTAKLLQLCDENILQKDPQRDQKDQAFAEAYLSRVREALQHKQGKYEAFLRIIYDFETSKSQGTAVELYSSLHDLLYDYPQLLKDFAAFLLPDQALECGLFEEQQAFDKSRRFLRQLEICFAENPSHHQKIIKVLQGCTECLPEEIAELKTQMSQLLKGHDHLQEEFSMFFDHLRPPASRMGDFEIINWTEEKEYEFDGFEEVSLPDVDEDDEPPKVPTAPRSKKRKETGSGQSNEKEMEWAETSTTKECTCSCHEAMTEHRLKRTKRRACNHCGCKMSDSKSLKSKDSQEVVSAGSRMQLASPPPEKKDAVNRRICVESLQYKKGEPETAQGKAKTVPVFQTETTSCTPREELVDERISPNKECHVTAIRTSTPNRPQSSAKRGGADLMRGANSKPSMGRSDIPLEIPQKPPDPGAHLPIKDAGTTMGSSCNMEENSAGIIHGLEQRLSSIMKTSTTKVLYEVPNLRSSASCSFAKVELSPAPLCPVAPGLTQRVSGAVKAGPSDLISYPCEMSGDISHSYGAKANNNLLKASDSLLELSTILGTDQGPLNPLGTMSVPPATACAVLVPSTTLSTVAVSPTTLETVPARSAMYGTVPIPFSALGAVPVPSTVLSAVLLPSSILGSVPVPSATACTLPAPSALLVAKPLPSTPLSAASVPTTTLGTVPVCSVKSTLPTVPVSSTYLSSVPVTAVSLSTMQVSSAAFCTAPVISASLSAKPIPSDTFSTMSFTSALLSTGLVPSATLSTTSIHSAALDTTPLPSTLYTSTGPLVTSALSMSPVNTSISSTPVISASNFISVPSVSHSTLSLSSAAPSITPVTSTAFATSVIPSAALSTPPVLSVTHHSTEVASLHLCTTEAHSVHAIDTQMTSVVPGSTQVTADRITDIKVPSLGIVGTQISAAERRSTQGPYVKLSSTMAPPVDHSSTMMPSVNLISSHEPCVGIDSSKVSSVGLTSTEVLSVGVGSTQESAFVHNSPQASLSSTQVSTMGISSTQASSRSLSKIQTPVDVSNIQVPSVGFSTIQVPHVDLCRTLIPCVGISNSQMPSLDLHNNPKVSSSGSTLAPFASTGNLQVPSASLGTPILYATISSSEAASGGVINLKLPTGTLINFQVPPGNLTGSWQASSSPTSLQESSISHSCAQDISGSLGGMQEILINIHNRATGSLVSSNMDSETCLTDSQCRTSEELGIRTSPEPSSMYNELESEPGASCLNEVIPLHQENTSKNQGIGTELTVCAKNSKMSSTGEKVVLWTREADRVILTTCQERGAHQETFSAISQQLGHKTPNEISRRFRELMRLFHTSCEVSSEEEEDATSTSNTDQLSDRDLPLSEDEQDE
ncbi:GON-4-like protein isoform X2 [Ambystoma mexicanum]|uniref:GON-4-like protein isoform X2 n=1 Tax=Ambystoma mexicanum TaxID=8296 RepID=UPI0037E88754